MNDPPSLDEMTKGWNRKASQFTYEAAVTAIIRAYSVVIPTHESAYADLDLTFSRFAVLGTLDRSPDGELGLSALSRNAFLHPATLSYTLDHLEQRGLINRRPGENDRRHVTATITPAGRTLIKEALRRLSRLRFGLAGLNEDEATKLIELLAKVQPVERLPTAAPGSSRRNGKGRPAAHL